MIDLRSDTVTRPTASMRRAIAEAEVGDAVLEADPTAAELEKTVAEILGKPAALFMPSGSMANQIALRIHCDRGSEFICEADAHIYHYEQAAFAQLSGLVAKTVAGDRGLLTAKHLQGQIRPDNDHMVRTRLVCLENTHNRWGGRIHRQRDVDAICRWAHSHGLASHLDGARLWNAAAATGADAAELTRNFDSASVCFSKGLGAPVGSALAGSCEFIDQARRARKLFGGAMRQIGILAAGALYGLRHHRQRLLQDHAHAQEIAESIATTAALTLAGNKVETNIIVAELDPEWGSAERFVAALAEQDVACFAIGPQTLRLVTHLDVTGESIRIACRAIRSVAETSLTGRTSP